MAQLEEIKDKKIIDSLLSINANKELKNEEDNLPSSLEVPPDEVSEDLVSAFENFKTKEPNILEKTADFFSGTKKTEFIDLPEFGYNKETDPYLGKTFPSQLKTAAKLVGGFALTPNIKGQMNIIEATIPEVTFTQDKFNNIIVVMPDGKGFYLNKPGASQKDIMETTSQILMYIPGFSSAMKWAGKSYLKKLVGSSAAGLGTSLVQDIAATPFGATGEGEDKRGVIDVPKAVISTFAPAIFEGAINPLARTVWSKIFGNPAYYKIVEKPVVRDGKKTFEKEYVFTEKGKQAAKAAGLDVDKIDSNMIKTFTTEIGKGVDADIAAAQSAAGKFGFRLSKSQAKQDVEGMATLYEGAKGSFGKEAQDKILNFLSKQNVDIGNTAKSLITKFNRGQIGDDSLEGVGQSVQQQLKNFFKKASDAATTKYNAVEKTALFNGRNSNIDVLNASVKKAVEDVSEATGIKGTGIIDKELTPATIKALSLINDFVKRIKNKKVQKATPSTFQSFDNELKKMNSVYQTAKNKTDQKNVMAVKKELEKFIDDNVDNFLFSGTKDSLKYLKQAKKLFSDLKQKYEPNPIRKGGIKIQDNAGRTIQKILIDPDVTPMKTMDYIFGVSTLGRKADALSIIRRLKKIFNAEGKDLGAIAAKNADFQSLRTGFFNKLIKDSVKNNQFNKEAFVKNWETVTKRDMALVKELFDDDEIKLIGEFVTEVRKTFKPKDVVNSSNTASALMRAINGVARQLVGIVGFKTASIQGLLLARSGFDRIRDYSGTKGAQKILDEEIFGLGARKISPIPVAAETGLINQNLGGTANVSVPYLPSGLLTNQ